MTTRIVPVPRSNHVPTTSVIDPLSVGARSRSELRTVSMAPGSEAGDTRMNGQGIPSPGSQRRHRTGPPTGVSVIRPSADRPTVERHTSPMSRKLRTSPSSVNVVW